MASGKTSAWANTLLNMVLGATAFTPATPVFVASYTVTPTASGGGTEATGGGYVRVSITNNTTNWPNASGGVKSNGTSIAWSAATSGGWSSGSNQVGAALLDASSAGNMYYFGDLTVAKPVTAGDTPSYANGAFQVTET